MIKVARAHDINTNDHIFSVIADDKGFKYVFSKDNVMFDSKKRVAMLMEKAGESAADFKTDDFLALARVGLTFFKFSNAREEENEKIAVSEEMLSIDKALDRSMADSNISDVLVKTNDDIEEVFIDYPELYEQLSSDDPEQKITADGMLELVLAAVGDIDPQGPNAWLLDVLDGKEIPKGTINDIVIGDATIALTAAVDPDACPPATQDIKLNIKNRQNAIDNIGYGPLNPEEPNDKFWQGKADRWNTTIEDAKTSRCGNCAAFIKTSKMLKCISEGLQQGDENVTDSYDVVTAGDLGYCEALDFKCAAARTCDAWIAGGPVTDETGKEQE
jgi:hypothetical protein